MRLLNDTRGAQLYKAGGEFSIIASEPRVGVLSEDSLQIKDVSSNLLALRVSSDLVTVDEARRIVSVSPVLPLGYAVLNEAVVESVALTDLAEGEPVVGIVPGSIGSTFDSDLSGWTKQGAGLTATWVNLGGDLGGAMRFAHSASMFSGSSSTYRTAAELDYQEGGVLTIEIAFREQTTGAGSRSIALELKNGTWDVFDGGSGGYQLYTPAGTYIGAGSYVSVGDYKMARIDMDSANSRWRDYATTDGVTWTPNTWNEDTFEFWDWSDAADMYLLVFTQMTAGFSTGHTYTVHVDRFVASIA